MQLRAGGLQKRRWGSANAPYLIAASIIEWTKFSSLKQHVTMISPRSRPTVSWFSSTIARIRLKYRHEPLDTGKDEIRLLIVLPDLDKDGLIRCELATFDLVTAPEFQALSYEWGSARQRQPIWIDNGRMRIRRNLWLFLDMFRIHDRNNIPLWIDQICIDQSNDSERGHQVKLMGSIYSKAVRTIVWLGLSEGVDIGISEALMRHGQLYSQLSTATERMKKCKSPIDRFTRPEGIRELFRAEPLCTDGVCALCNTSLRTSDNWIGYHLDMFARGISLSSDIAKETLKLPSNLRDLCDLTYWSRLWIIQENVLAKERIFFLGNRQYSRSDINHYSSLQELFYERFHKSPPLLGPHVSALTEVVGPVNNLSLDQAILRFSGSRLGCSDSHDMVYALLGLVNPTYRIPVDYQSTLPEVFDLLMSAIILSPTLVETLRGAVRYSLTTALERIGYRLGTTLRWDYWVQAKNFKEHLGSELEEFLMCLVFLERIGLRKEPWTGYELGSIVHTARQIEHTLLPSRDTHDESSATRSRANMGCTVFVKRVNCATRQDLTYVLSKIVGSARKRGERDNPAYWETMFYRTTLPGNDQILPAD